MTSSRRRSPRAGHAEIMWIDGGGHSFEVKGRKRPPAEIAAELAPQVVAWMRRRHSGPGPT